MAQVPQQVLPDVAPSAQPTPEERIQAPPGAFAGTVIGQAASDIGEGAAKASENLASYATTLQQVYNHQAANANGMAAGEEMYAAVSKWKEENRLGQAVLTQPQIVQQLNAIGEKHMAGLSLAAQVDYQDVSRRFQLYTNSEVSSYAAEQGHLGIQTNAIAIRDSTARLYALDPDKPGADDLLHQQVGLAAAQYFQGTGLTGNDPLVKDWVQQGLSTAYGSQIHGLIVSGDTDKANALLSQHKGDLDVKTYGELDGELRTVNTANNYFSIANAAINGGTPPAAGGTTPFTKGGATTLTPESANLVPINTGANTIRMNAGVQSQAEALIADLRAHGAPVGNLVGADEHQTDVAGTHTISAHKVGLAFDDSAGIAWLKAHPDEARAIAKAHGAFWGGDFKTADPEHFTWSSASHGSVPWNPTTGAYGAAQGGALAAIPPPANGTDVDRYSAQAQLAAQAAAVRAYPNPQDQEQRQAVINAGDKLIHDKIGPITEQEDADQKVLQEYILHNGIQDITQVQRQFPGQWNNLDAGRQSNLIMLTKTDTDPVASALNVQHGNELLANAQQDPNALKAWDVNSAHMPLAARTDFLKRRDAWLASGQGETSVTTTRVMAMPQVQQTLVSLGAASLPGGKLDPSDPLAIRFAGMMYGEIENLHEKKVSDKELNDLATRLLSRPGALAPQGAAPPMQLNIPGFGNVNVPLTGHGPRAAQPGTGQAPVQASPDEINAVTKAYMDTHNGEIPSDWQIGYYLDVYRRYKK